jgi:copper(I)-binding protein
MTRPTRRAVAVIAALGLLVPAAARAQGTQPPAAETRAGAILVTQPWSRAAMRGGSGAAFLTLRNTGTAPDRLLGASTPAAGKVELHSMVRDGDVMRMREQPAIDLPPGQEVVLRPGGLHIMMLGLAQPLDRGATLPLTLRFEQAGEVTIQVAVQAAGAAGMPAMGGGHGHTH